jgi:hypothetical protein
MSQDGKSLSQSGQNGVRKSNKQKISQKNERLYNDRLNKRNYFKV